MAEQPEAQEGWNTRRLRARRVTSVAGTNESSLSARPRSGLLTPEPSALTESQLTEPNDEESQITQLNGQESLDVHFFPIMQLPAELRLLIYYMALHCDEPILLHTPRAAPEKSEEEDQPRPVSEVGTHITAMNGHTRSSLSIIDPRYMRPPPAPASTPPAPIDSIVPVLLRLNRQIYREARQVLYSDNVFTFNLSSGVHTLSTLHQRSRSLIKHVILTIPSHHDILDGFADLVRLGLRYLWGLKTFKIILQASLPDDGRVFSGATSVYANAFHILRWLPKNCKVILDGNVPDIVRQVVAEEGRLQSVLDEVSISVWF